MQQTKAATIYSQALHKQAQTPVGTLIKQNYKNSYFIQIVKQKINYKHKRKNNKTKNKIYKL